MNYQINNRFEQYPNRCTMTIVGTTQKAKKKIFENQNENVNDQTTIDRHEGIQFDHK